MEKVILKAEPRHVGRHSNRELRNADRIPAVVYGQHIDAQAVSLVAKGLGLALQNSGGSVIEMEIAGQPTLHVLVRELQRNPIKHNIQHIDFLAVSMDQKVRVHVPIVAQGTAPVLSNADMVLVRNLDSVEIECLPGDIPQHLVADLSKLVTVDDEVLVKDLALPANIKLMTEGDHVVLAVTLSRAGAMEEAAEVEAASPAEVEVVAKRKPKEEEEPAKK